MSSFYAAVVLQGNIFNVSFLFTGVQGFIYLFSHCPVSDLSLNLFQTNYMWEINKNKKQNDQVQLKTI